MNGFIYRENLSPPQSNQKTSVSLAMKSIIRCKKRGKRVEVTKVLPDELIEEILWRLPVKSIIRCGCVCKSWYSLIRTRNFISTHLRKTKNTQPFLYEKDDDDVDRRSLTHNQISLIFHNPDRQLDHRVFNLPADPFFTFQVASSRNGILCLVDQQYGSNFILLNPSIRHSLLVPTPQFVALSREIANQELLGFGFDDDISSDYKIIRIVKSTNHYWDAELYSLNSNCWRDILAPVPNFNYCIGQNNIGTFANGRLHWAVQENNTNLILVFNLKDETFHHLSLPKCFANSQLECIKIVELGESSIGLLYQERVGGAPVDCDPLAWIMREYGAVESWQPISIDEAEDIFLGCQIKDVNEEFIDMVDSSKNSSHLYVRSLELLDRKGLLGLGTNVRSFMYH